ncbi:phytase [Lysobacter sp. F60174L2]|uniref:phytase n=1 Tax=Lysobacter sp. F60174L2 TaxID=3459295 RepID=UPI00403DF57B
MTLRPLYMALPALLLAACATRPPRAEAPATPPDAPVFDTVPERYVSATDPADELDSLASWTSPTGDTWLIASAKSTDQLVVFDADTGERLRTVGGPGDAVGRFDRPNGVAVHGDHLFVVERDNHRVQVFALPGFEPLGSFGQDRLRAPYGLWINETEPGELEIYVTDSFMYGERFDVVPPLAELDQRVRRYRLVFDQQGRPRSHYAGSFGDTGAENALRVVESIAGDPGADRLLIADERIPREDGRNASTLREYSFKGRYTGRSLPQDAFAAEAEGVALWSCSATGGYWIAVDQLAPLTMFHLFERDTLAPAGSFKGAVTAFTDGVTLHAASTRAFPRGALFAVHDDAAVAAFDLADIAHRLGLSAECGG